MISKMHHEHHERWRIVKGERQKDRRIDRRPGAHSVNLAECAGRQTEQEGELT